MKISADFDSGNIQVVDASDPQRVLLAMRPDLNSHHFQWFHFQVEGLQPGQGYGFCLTNAVQDKLGVVSVRKLGYIVSLV